MGTCRRPRNHLTDMASQAAVPRAASAGPSRERREISLPDDWPGAFDAAWSFGPLLEDAARDDEALYLTCALVDLRDPRVAVAPLDWMILHVPVAGLCYTKRLRGDPDPAEVQRPERHLEPLSFGQEPVLLGDEDVV